MIAGDQQALLGLVQADVRRRVSGCLVDVEVTEIGLDPHARQQQAVRLDDARDGRTARAALAVAGQRGRWHAALASHLQAPLEQPLGLHDRACRVPVVRVHPQLAPGRVDDRAGLPVMVGVRVRADDQPHVLEAKPRLVERQLELAQRAGLVNSGVDQDDPAARRDRIGVDVRHPGPRQWKAQAPDAGQHAIGAGERRPATGAHASTPGFTMSCRSSARFASRRAVANAAGRSRSYQRR